MHGSNHMCHNLQGMMPLVWHTHQDYHGAPLRKTRWHHDSIQQRQVSVACKSIKDAQHCSRKSRPPFTHHSRQAHPVVSQVPRTICTLLSFACSIQWGPVLGAITPNQNKAAPSQETTPAFQGRHSFITRDSPKITQRQLNHKRHREAQEALEAVHVPGTLKWIISAKALRTSPMWPVSLFESKHMQTEPWYADQPGPKPANTCQYLRHPRRDGVTFRVAHKTIAKG